MKSPKVKRDDTHKVIKKEEAPKGTAKGGDKRYYAV